MGKFPFGVIKHQIDFEVSIYEIRLSNAYFTAEILILFSGH